MDAIVVVGVPADVRRTKFYTCIINESVKISVHVPLKCSYK